MKSSTKRKLSEYRSNKTARPFIEGRALHVTMRSQVAKGKWSLASKHIRTWLREFIPLLARKMGVRLYHVSNNGNHLHIVMLPTSRVAMSNFLRVLSGVIPRRVMKVEKGRPNGIKFWESRPYSRVLSWGPEFKNVMSYVQRNVLEAIGFISHEPRKRKLADRKLEYIERTLILSRRKRQDFLNLQPSLF